MGAAGIPAGCKRCPASRDASQGRAGIRRITYVCRVIRRADNDKVIIHQFASLQPVSLLNEAQLGGACMHDHQVSITILRVFQRLPCANSNNPHRNACLGCKSGCDMSVKPGILC